MLTAVYKNRIYIEYLEGSFSYYRPDGPIYIRVATTGGVFQKIKEWNVRPCMLGEVHYRFDGPQIKEVQPFGQPGDQILYEYYSFLGMEQWCEERGIDPQDMSDEDILAVALRFK